MVILDAPSIPAAQAAWCAGQGRAAAWVTSPGTDDLIVGREWVACDPVETVRGSDVAALDAAWTRARARWGASRPGVPVGIGYLGYDLGRHLVRFADQPRAESGWPDLEVSFYDAIWEHDRFAGRTHVLAVSDGAARDLLARLTGFRSLTERPSIAGFRSVDPAAEHGVAVRRVLAYLRAGDAYQINLARRLVADLAPDGSPLGWSWATRLARDSPAPHAAWMVSIDGDACLIGNSPERFLWRHDDGLIETRPIKGTRARGNDDWADAAARAELRSSVKDAAEHAMIVDLERNDLGRVCITGSVEVKDTARVVSLPTVHHLVSTVQGRLRPDVDLAALLGATFPGGSITGAPKRRAMEIIAELEPARRGPYTGATGWLGAAGDLDLAVAIRTALVRDQRVTLWVGGGIVVDSQPDDELRETEAKAEAFVRLMV